MPLKKRKERFELPPPFKSKVKSFIRNNKTTLFFVLFIFCFIALYFVGLHLYWKIQYTNAGQGYIYGE